MSGEKPLTLADILNSWPKEKCEICGKEFPDITLMHISRDEDSPISCSRCFFEHQEKLAKLLFGVIE